MSKKKKKSFQLSTLPFIIVSIITLVFALIKTTSSETKDIYVKVKISQGFWWASTAKPNIWFAQGIKKNDIEYNLLKKPIAKILEVRYYPFSLKDDTYDIYIKVKLTASYDKRKNQYVFKRSGVVIGAPIEFETSGAQISGTVIEISENEFENKYVEKVVTFLDEGAYTSDNPYLYNSIQIGDQYFDGEEVVFEVIDKQLRKTVLLANDQYGNIYGRQIPSVQNILITAKMIANERGDYLYFGEEKLLTVGSSIFISAANFKLDDGFIIGEINEFNQ